MSDHNSDFIQRTSQAMNTNNFIPKNEKNDVPMNNIFLNDKDFVIPEPEPIKPSKVVLISGKYDDKYLPEDNLSGFKRFFKIPAIQVLFVVGLGVIVMILVFAALS